MGPSKKSLSLSYRAFPWPLPSYNPLGFLFQALQILLLIMESLHRAASRAISGFLSSSSSFLDTSRIHSFPFVILRAGPSSPNLLLHFKFGQTWSETKTLQILLEAFCVHSPANASFHFSEGGSPCLPSLSSSEFAFLHCGVYPFFPTLPL